MSASHSALLYFPLSQPSRAVQWFLRNHNIKDVELKPVDILSGATHTPEFSEKINAFQSVPVLQLSAEESGADGGQYLTESSAILNYLASKYKIETEYPLHDAKAVARVHEAQFRHDELSRLVTTMAVRPALARAMNRSVSKEDVIAKLKSNSGDIMWVLLTLDKMLGAHKFIAGDHMTVADYQVICELNQLPLLEPLLPETLQISATHYPNVHQYLERAKLLPNYDASVAGIEALYPKLAH
mmetsp:Transcript_71416/g.83078  ORF Transcript_71416/g.83078 Transcript_71416/m.83078 type:complete len:242 (-) Transcript_71416:58-783(-)|eukprot:CAMPEP_0176409528 /NCGR_PEP_ID=MMETSP0127-20121128/2548_1 /TAXON_ID=938130 /ORGANISM="Platyophrya macrostoma, Strain WH" /LENGTH=241 /DNA_ID=CAMNT_0017788917 /DNA_START=41 /DNA_END=766 /DNA_ORIENTATION=+